MRHEHVNGGAFCTRRLVKWCGVHLHKQKSLDQQLSLYTLTPGSLMKPEFMVKGHGRLQLWPNICLILILLCSPQLQQVSQCTIQRVWCECHVISL